MIPRGAGEENPGRLSLRPEPSANMHSLWCLLRKHLSDSSGVSSHLLCDPGPAQAFCFSVHSAPLGGPRAFWVHPKGYKTQPEGHTVFLEEVPKLEYKECWDVRACVW